MKTYRLYSTLLCNFELCIDINLAELDTLRVIGKLLEKWTNHPAGPTPVCPEVNDYRLTRIDLWGRMDVSASTTWWELTIVLNSSKLFIGVTGMIVEGKSVCRRRTSSSLYIFVFLSRIGEQITCCHVLFKMVWLLSIFPNAVIQVSVVQPFTPGPHHRLGNIVGYFTWNLLE